MIQYNTIQLKISHTVYTSAFREADNHMVYFVFYIKMKCFFFLIKNIFVSVDNTSSNIFFTQHSLQIIKKG